MDDPNKTNYISVSNSSGRVICAPDIPSPQDTKNTAKEKFICNQVKNDFYQQNGNLISVNSQHIPSRNQTKQRITHPQSHSLSRKNTTKEKLTQKEVQNNFDQQNGNLISVNSQHIPSQNQTKQSITHPQCHSQSTKNTAKEKLRQKEVHNNFDHIPSQNQTKQNVIYPQSHSQSTKNTAKDKLTQKEVQNNFDQQNGNLISVNSQHIPSQNRTKQSVIYPQNHSRVRNNVRVPKSSALRNSNLIYVKVNNQLNSTMKLNRESLRTTDTLTNPGIVNNTEDNTIINIDVDLDPISTLTASAKTFTMIDITDNENSSLQDPHMTIKVNPAIVKNIKDNTIINIDVDPDPISTLTAESRTINDITDNKNYYQHDPDFIIMNVEDNKETQTTIDLTDNDDTIHETVNSKNKITEIANGRLLTDDDMLCEKYYKDMNELAEIEAMSEINIDYLLNDINIEEIVEALNECNPNYSSENNDPNFVKASTMVMIDLESSQSPMPHVNVPLDDGKLICGLPITHLDTCNLFKSNENATSFSQVVKDNKLHVCYHSEKRTTFTSSQQVHKLNLLISKSRNSGEKLPAAPSSQSGTGNPSNGNEKLNAAPTSLSENGKNVHTYKIMNTGEKFPAAPCLQPINIGNVHISKPVKSFTITMNSLPEKDKNLYPKNVCHNGEEVTAVLNSQTDIGKPSNCTKILNARPTAQVVKNTELQTSNHSEKLAASTNSQPVQGQMLYTRKSVNIGKKLSGACKSSNFILNAAPTVLSAKSRDVHTNKTIYTGENLFAASSSQTYTGKASNSNEKLNATPTSQSDTGTPSNCNEKLNAAPTLLSNTVKPSNCNEKLNAAPTLLRDKGKPSKSNEKLNTAPTSLSNTVKPSKSNEKLNATPTLLADTGKPSKSDEKLNAAPNLLADRGRPSKSNEKLNATPTLLADTGKLSKSDEKLNATPTLLADTGKPSKSGEKLNSAPTLLADTGKKSKSNVKLNAVPTSLSNTVKSSNCNDKRNAAPTLLADTGKQYKSNEKLSAAPTSLSEKGRNVPTNKTLNSCEKLTATPSSRSHAGKPNCNGKLNAAPTSLSENSKSLYTSKAINTSKKPTAAPRPQQGKNKKLHKSKSVDRGKKLDPQSSLSQKFKKPTIFPSLQPIKDQNIHTTKPLHSGEKYTMSAYSSQSVKNTNLHTSKPHTIDRKLFTSSSQQQQKFEKLIISQISHTTIVPNVHTSESKKYNNKVKDQNLQTQKSLHDAQSSKKTSTLHILQEQHLGKFEKKKIKTPKHSHVRTTAKNTTKKDSLIATENSHQVITKNKCPEINQNVANIKKKIYVATKSNFGAIINSKVALKNYVIPKIRKELGKCTLTKTKPSVNNIDFCQSHLKQLFNTNLNKENKCKDEQSENSYCELSLIRDEIEKFITCRSECASFDDIEKNKVEKCGTKVCENSAKLLCCNDKKITLYNTELDGTKNKKYINTKLNDPRAGISYKNELIQSLLQNDRKRKLIDVYEKRNVENNTEFKFENASDIKKRNYIDTKGSIFVRSHINKFIYNDGNSTETNTQTNAKKRGHNEIKVDSKEFCEKMITSEYITSDTHTDVTPPKKVCTTTITKNDLKVLNERYAARRDNKTNNPSTAQHQKSDKKTSSKDNLSDVCFENVTVKDNSASTFKAIMTLRSVKNLAQKRSNGTYNNSNTPNEANTISHKEFIAMIPTSTCTFETCKTGISSVESSFSVDKEANTISHEEFIAMIPTSTCTSKTFKTGISSVESSCSVEKEANTISHKEFIAMIPTSTCTSETCKTGISSVESSFSVDKEANTISHEEFIAMIPTSTCTSKTSKTGISSVESSCSVEKEANTISHKEFIAMIPTSTCTSKTSKTGISSVESSCSVEKEANTISHKEFIAMIPTSTCTSKTSKTGISSVESSCSVEKEANTISHKEFIATIPTSTCTSKTSKTGISSVESSCYVDKEANIVNESCVEITYQKNSRIKLMKRNSVNYTSKDISSQTDAKSNLYSLLHSCLVGRYNIDSVLYKGQHSYILKARNKTDNRMVAVKILMKMSFLLECRHIEILRKLADADITKYFSCIEIEDIFWARHWCISMEFYPLNLIQALESCGYGFTIDKVQQLSWQLLTALLMLRVTQIVHTDIKPSHILINAEHTKLKLTGFDKAIYGKEVEVSPHIGTLNYRSPELFLGINISYPTDVWSTACTIFEMATNQKLFEGADNHSVFENIMCLRDMAEHTSDRLLSEGIFSEDSKWKYVKKFTKDDILIKLFNVYNSSISPITNECRKIIMLGDLLDSMLTLNHSERKTVELAYVHPFISKQL